MTLKNIVQTSNAYTGCKGFLALGDSHAEYYKLKQATDYAESENLHVIVLGDIVDGGQYPFETLQLVYSLVKKGSATFVIGNHDYKFYRHAIGKPVILKSDQERTLSLLDNVHDEYMSMMVELHRQSSFVLSIDNWVFAHAAIPNEFWNSNTFDTDVCIYGDVVSGTTDYNGYPYRSYDWLSYIPSGTTVVVGHDRRPLFENRLYHPKIVVNDNKGVVIFTDTGCGKSPAGILSGIVLSKDNGIRFERIVQFK